MSLSYLKPSIQVTRGLGGQNQLRARLFRDVSQLDFTDFVSRASLSDDIIEGGNPDLRPQTSWQAEVAADLRFGGEGALSLTAFRQWISDTVDLVTLGPPGGGSMRPAISAMRDVWGVEVSLTAPAPAGHRRRNVDRGRHLARRAGHRPADRRASGPSPTSRKTS